MVVPDSDGLVKSCKKFFQELSLVFEQCQLGKHMPYQALPDGIFRVGKKLAASVNEKPMSDWFKKLGTSRLHCANGCMSTQALYLWNE